MLQIRTPLAAALLAMLITGCAGLSQEGEETAEKEKTGEKAEEGERVTEDEVSSAEDAETDDAKAAGAESDGGVRSENLRRDAIDQDDGPLSKRTVYFDFDSSDIKTEYAKLLAAHGEYLGANPDVVVTVEGHTDERGSREYNLALGKRRAQSVKQVLTLNGAADEQVKTVSYGEERPAVEGHDEQAWAKNRRAKLVYER